MTLLGRCVLVLVLAVASVAVAAAPAQAQFVVAETETLDFDRPESWGMKYYASLALLTSMGVPEKRAAGSVDLGFEGSIVPQMNDQERRIGFNGTKLEDVNKTSFFGRIRGSVALGKGLWLELGYTPPVELGGAKPNILALGLGRPFELSSRWRLGVRGYGQIGKLMETFGSDVNYFFNVDPVAAQLLDARSLLPGLGDLTKEMIKRYQAVKGLGEVPPHASMGFNQSWIFFTDVLPRAVRKHGGIDPEALRKASLETDIRVGGTIQGYGVKFYPPGHALAGQNERSSPVVMQYVNGRTYSAWPKAIRTTDPLFPFPKGHPYGQ